MHTHPRTPHVALAGLLAVALSASILTAAEPQLPAPDETPATVQAPAPEGGRGGAQPAGRGGRGGGRGAVPGTALVGGPQLSDPIYADFEAMFPESDPVLPQSPEDELKEFILQPGYRLELVLADPIIQEPAAIAFDGNGRMFVLEIRGYMKTADADGERDPVGRISLHEDTNNDGIYDKHSVFVDNLVFPRWVTPFGPGTILTMETDQGDVWKYTDTNDDGVADRKELFTTGMGRQGNVEHQPSFLTWTMDNWMYSTYNAARIRWTPGGAVLREPTGTNSAAWGVTQDNDGKQWFQGGASGLPGYFQFPVAYGNFDVPDRLLPDMNIPWGAPVRIADMQNGLNIIRMPDGSLSRTTAGAGNDIVRAHRMPADMQGHYLYGEPVARIVRRIEPVVEEGVTRVRNFYKGNEFIKSTDPLFRPVDIATAPDGTIYIADMYRGIIQEAQWTGEGTYLRARIQQYDLDKVHSLGRIWRLTYEGMPRDRTVPRMHNQTSAQLVAHLGHANGWWRDTAQQLLVLRQDRSIAPALVRMARSRENVLARMHALWTLEGIGALEPALVRELMRDPEPRIQVQAIRASETLYKAGDRSFDENYAILARSTEAAVSIQALLTMKMLNVTALGTVAQAARDTNRARGIQVVAEALLNPPATNETGNLNEAQQVVMDRGRAIYAELCYACHGTDGLGAPRPDGSGTMLAPALAGVPRVTGHEDYLVNVLLKGLNGPIPGTPFNDIMVPMGDQNDRWIADVASYVRNSFGNYASFIEPEDVASLRATTTSRTTPWTFAEVTARVPQPLTNQATWDLAASHNVANARNALATYNTWTANTAQQPGDIWYQIELPNAASLTEIRFTSAAGGGGRGGRGGGRGGAQAEVVPASLPPAPPERQLVVELSADGNQWSPAGTIIGADGQRVLRLEDSVPARFVRIRQVQGAPTLSIGNLRLFQGS
jgi:mono/diheme cytochrome c family protein/glucose/arabinose dehydrogenase